MKNLLIDGMPGCGKTTAINDALRSLGLLPFCAGFRTVRVYSEEGSKRGFAQLPASLDQGIDVFTDEQMPHMILDFRKMPPFVTETFTGFTVESLSTIPGRDSLSAERNNGAPEEKNAGKIRLILMDEIGGAELRLPGVQEAFLEALKGEIPCIGVIKSDEHAKKFAYDSYRKFRARIENETDTKFLYMNEENRWEVRERIFQWLSRLSEFHLSGSSCDYSVKNHFSQACLHAAAETPDNGNRGTVSEGRH